MGDWITETALPWMGGAVSDIGNFYTGNQGWLNPLLSMGGTALIAALQNQGSNKAVQQNQQLWQQTAYPRKEAVEASAIQNRGELGQARLGAGQNFFNQLAARGFMSGSGLGVKGQADINRAYAQAYGKMLTDQTKFANTPITPLPSQAYYQPQVSPLAAGAKSGTDYLSMAMGYQNMMKMIQNLQGGGKTPLTSSAIQQYQFPIGKFGSSLSEGGSYPGQGSLDYSYTPSFGYNPYGVTGYEYNPYLEESYF